RPPAISAACRIDCTTRRRVARSSGRAHSRKELQRCKSLTACRAETNHRHGLQLERSPFGNRAGRDDFEGERQRLRHHARFGTHAQGHAVNSLRSVPGGVFQGDLQCLLHQADFVYESACLSMRRPISRRAVSTPRAATADKPSRSAKLLPGTRTHHAGGEHPESIRASPSKERGSLAWPKAKVASIGSKHCTR